MENSIEHSDQPNKVVELVERTNSEHSDQQDKVVGPIERTDSEYSDQSPEAKECIEEEVMDTHHSQSRRTSTAKEERKGKRRGQDEWYGSDAEEYDFVEEVPVGQSTLEVGQSGPKITISTDKVRMDRSQKKCPRTSFLEPGTRHTTPLPKRQSILRARRSHTLLPLQQAGLGRPAWP